MIFQLFTQLTNALTKSPMIALSAAFIWGILSIILSPCHLSSIPLIIGFLSGQRQLTFKKTFLYTLLFSTGILLSIVMIGLITGLLGRIIGDIGPIGNIIMAVLFFVIGFYLVGILPLPFLNKLSKPQYNKQGIFSAFILGLLFGLAVGPCTFAYMAPMLGIVFKTAADNFVYASLFVICYAIGHCLVIILAGFFFELVEKLLKWNKESIVIKVIKIICGVLVILGGIYLLIDAIKRLIG